jgi:hypothetical protein
MFCAFADAQPSPPAASELPSRERVVCSLTGAERTPVASAHEPFHEPRVDAGGHRLLAGDVRMQLIARVVGGQNRLRN